MRSAAVLLLLLLAGTLAATAQAASPDEGDRIAAFLATLAPPPEGAIPFVEKRMSALLLEPIEVRGELRVGKDGAIDKQVTAPTKERVQITAGTLTLERGGKTRTVDLAGNVRWKTFHAGITGLLNRDPAALARAFTIELDDAPNGWTMTLRPHTGGRKNMVTLISAFGEGRQLLRVRLEQSEAEWQEMTFLQDGN